MAQRGVGLRERVVDLLERPACVAAFGDVARVDHDAVDETVVDEVGRDHLQPAELTVATADADLERSGRRAATALAQRAEHLVHHAPDRRGARSRTRAKLAPTSKPGEARRRRADVLDVAVLAVHEHVVGRVLGQRPEPLLARSHRLLGPHAGQRRDQRVADDRQRLAVLAGARAAGARYHVSVTEPIASSIPLSQSACVPAIRRTELRGVPGVLLGPAALDLARAGRQDRGVGADEPGQALQHRRRPARSTSSHRRGHERARGLGDQRLGRDARLQRQLGSAAVFGFVGHVLERSDVAGDRPVDVADRGEAACGCAGTRRPGGARASARTTPRRRATPRSSTRRSRRGRRGARRAGRPCR